jgi:uncharacterized protein with HEPN domain
MKTANDYLRHVADKNVLDVAPEFETEHPEIAREFYAARGMRNMLAHGHFAVDVKIVWNTATIDIPIILKAVETILK